nr:hypothetical protein [Tanacetum cinerariifolium]
MRERGCATWDGGNSTWEGRAKGFGIVPVCVRAQEKLGRGGCFGGKRKSDEVEKYVGGLPDIIQRSVIASKPKTMQDAIKFGTKLMDQKICTLADRQVENKRKLDDTSRNNQNQQQAFKRHNVARAYTVRPGEKKVSFVSTSFSSLIDTIPTTLDHGYDVELADDFPEVFPEDLLGIPPIRQVELHIDLVPCAAPYKTQFLTLGSFDLFCQEKGWIIPDVHQLPGINKLTVKNRYSLPRINDLFDKL